MKPFLFLLAFSAPVLAQNATPTPEPEPERATTIAPIPADAPLVAPPVASRDLTVELVGNSIALVRDARRVSLQGGANRLRLVGVPVARTTLGLSLTPRVRILRDLGQRSPASVARETFELSKFIGQKITILRPVGNEEKAVTGTLLSLEPLLLETSDGVLLNPQGQWVLPSGNAPKASGPAAPRDDAKAEPEWILGAPAPGEHLAEYRYQVKGLDFSPGYTATLRGERVGLEGVIGVQNELGEATTRDLRGMTLVVANATVRFAGPLNLNVGANAFGFVSAEAPLQSRFSFRRRTPFEQAFQNVFAQRSVFVENTTENGLGVFLPVGKLILNRTVEQNGVPTTSLVSQTDGWGGFAPGGQIDLPLGPSDTVKVSRSVTNRLLNPVTREWDVELSISSDQNLTLSEPLPRGARLTQASPKPNTSEVGVLTWNLPPSESTIIVKYTVQTPT